MGDVSKGIGRYLRENIALSRGDISETKKSREWFLNRVANVIVAREGQPVLYAPERFVYFGSYFKGTKVKNVDEYDVLVVIDSNSGVFSQSGVAVGTGQGSASPNHKYDQRYFKSDGSGVSPAKMLNWLRGVVKEVTDAFGGEAPERQGQAVTATIKSQNLTIDLVPAGVFEHQQHSTRFYNIPRGDKSNGWIATSPRADVELLGNVAKDKNDFRNVIRIAKRIRDTHNLLLSSFAIESAIVQYGSASPWNNDLYRDGRGALLYLGALLKQGTVPDPYDSSNNLISGVENLGWYAERIERIVGVLDTCNAQVRDQAIVDARVKKVFENE